MKPNVMHLVEYLYQGGIERFLGEFARLIPEDEIEQYFFAYEMENFSGISNEIKSAGKKIHLYKKNLGYDSHLVRRLNRLIREEKINVIHTHDFGPMEYAVLLKIMNPNLKLIHTQHTLHHFIIVKRYLIFFQFASFFYSSIYVVSNHMKEILKKKCRFMRKEIGVINNGVDMKRYSQIPGHIEMDNKLRLVAISRISREKNLLFILQTCKMLKRHGIDFELHHAGTGGVEVKKIFDYVEKNNLVDNVFLYGYQDDVRQILKKGDIFVSSSFTEGHPIAVLEAMASGRICLCSDIEAHRNIGAKSLIFFDLNKEDSLFNELIKIRKDKNKYLRLAEIAKQEVREMYSFDKMAGKYMESYVNAK